MRERRFPALESRHGAGVVASVAWSIGCSLAALAVAVGVPLLHLVVQPGSALHLSEFYVSLLGKILCFAICALAMDLIWGYTGILSLGHGLFFALGGYAMGMYLMRQIGLDGVYKSHLPDFMVFLDWKAYPWYWNFTEHFWYAVLLVLLVPGGLAFVFGYFAFRSRIRGVYFSIITQALTFAAMLLFFRNETGFGGNNGFTDFKRLLGFSVSAPSTRALLCALSGLVLIGRCTQPPVFLEECQDGLAVKDLRHDARGGRGARLNVQLDAP